MEVLLNCKMSPYLVSTRLLMKVYTNMYMYMHGLNIVGLPKGTHWDQV